MLTAKDKLLEITRSKQQCNLLAAALAHTVSAMIINVGVRSIVLTGEQAGVLSDWIEHGSSDPSTDRFQLAGQIATWLNSLGTHQNH